MIPCNKVQVQPVIDSALQYFPLPEIMTVPEKLQSDYFKQWVWHYNAKVNYHKSSFLFMSYLTAST
jgi:hypothetical protein